MKLSIKIIIFCQFITFLILVIAQLVVTFLMNQFFPLNMYWQVSLIVLGISLLSCFITPIAIKFFNI